mmetsp:Transcript_45840/g.74978  ORF Transcript_45840/g.74978 Transcript_45840/m.74978 type:complete len:102 (+) Transcript_45840:856-1161(+)
MLRQLIVAWNYQKKTEQVCSDTTPPRLPQCLTGTGLGSAGVSPLTHTNGMLRPTTAAMMVRHAPHAADATPTGRRVWARAPRWTRSGAVWPSLCRGERSAA